MDMTNMTIETANLLLESITLDYQEEIFTEFTPEITFFMFPKSPDTIEDTVEFIEKSIKENTEGRNLQLVVLNKEAGEYLGNAGIHNIDTRTPELGIWIKKSAHGNAYGKEAMVALKEWADKNLEYEHILYPVDEENFASRRIPEFLGGMIFREYDEENMSGRMQHILEYRISPSKK